MSALKNVLNLSKLELLITIGIAFCIPFNQKIVVYLIALLGLVSIISWITKGVNRLTISSWPFIILFIAYLVGLGFTTNFDYGLKDIETRSTFLLLPLFYGLTKRDKPLNLTYIFVALLGGTIVAVCFAYYQAFGCFEANGYPECFENARLSNPMHPTYFALYIILAGTFFLLKIKEHIKSWKFYLISIGIIAGALFMVYRLDSLGPWIGLAAMCAVLLFAYFHFQDKKKYFLIGLAIMAVLGLFAINTLDFLKKDVASVSKELGAYFDDKQAYVNANLDNPHSVNARIIIWSVTFDFIKENPLGVGTGDSKDELMKFYRAKGMDAYADKELNPHCQYLQTATSIGVLGSLFLLASLVYLVYLGFKQRNFYLIALVVLFGTACLFESVLERQWGILFFMFFLSVFLTMNKEKLLERDLGKTNSTE